MNATTQLSPDLSAGLANLLGVVGDNKYSLGMHLSSWSVGTPGLESAVACAAIAQAHLGQSRAVFPLANDLAGEGVELGPPDERERQYRMSCLDEPFDTWGQAVATLYLVDPALDIVLRALSGLSDELARRVARILDESHFNADFARGRVVELTTRWPAGRDQLQAHLPRIVTEVLCWFGPTGEPGVEALRDAGILTLDNDGMRSAWLDAVMPLLVEHGYDVGVTGEPGAWQMPDLPWDAWNGLQRRVEG
ncbi:Phenylacetic acid catabolic protein [Euzebya sp.]|uniref:Phenylacetic acid catabolic protein n=1 Tax=Euzebya sp. TaxID=1971409 RepID=UPI0035169697